VQKLIAKYAQAAHLAILAVAPLVACVFFDESTVATMTLWLSAISAVWVLMEPSIFRRERPHEARIRVVGAIVSDPVFWASLVMVAVCALRWLNSGVEMAYDAEAGSWFVAAPALEFMPGSVKGSGYLPFAATVALMVILQGCRHAMGRAARTSYFLISSFLAGAAAVLMIFLANSGHPGAVELSKCSSIKPSYVGIAFAIHFLSGVAAMAGAFERKWNGAIFVALFSLGGSAAGVFTFSPAYSSAAVAAAAIVLVVYSFAYMGRTVRKAAEFKYLVVLGLSLTLGTLLVLSMLPEALVAQRTAPFTSGEFFDENFMQKRQALSAIAFKVWSGNLWTGSGLGSFPIDITFNAGEEDWLVVAHNQQQALNGWWQLLAERGIVGAVIFAVMLGFLFFTYFRRSIATFKVWQMPSPSCLVAPLSVAIVAAVAFFDGSFMRADVVIAIGAAMAISAGLFPKERVDG
jgi:hypothetical protein